MNLPDPSTSQPEKSRLAFVSRLLHQAHSAWQAWTRDIFVEREERLFLVLAIVIGAFSGLAVVCFHIAIDWIRILSLGSSLRPSFPRVILAPVIGGLAVALLTIYLFPRVRGSGVNQTKAAVYVWDGYIPFSTVIGKFVTCAVALGSGQSLGPEDPSLQMGAGIASKIGRTLHLSQRKLRLIAPVGAAAGLAAAFNAPISAVLFVIEEVIGTWSAGVLGAIILAAVSSVVTMRWFLGSAPLFRIPAVQAPRPVEFFAYAILGVVGGCVSLLFTKWVEYSRPKIQALPSWTRYVLPSAAGLAIGAIGIWMPQVMGVGYAIMDQALHGQFAWKLLLILALVKILTTGFSFLSGTPGGLFAPTLFIGAMLGGGIGAIEQHFVPGLNTSIGAFALVGMGTLFGGFLRVPITSVFMVIEVSGNYAAALPVMVSSLIAYLISRRYQSVPLFDILTRQDGLLLPSTEERREHVVILVEDAMRGNGAIVTRAAEPVADLVQRAAAREDAPLLLCVRPGEWRLLDREDLQRQVADPAGATTAGDIKSRGPLPILFPDEPIDEALRWVGDWLILPVVSRADLGRIEGVLSLSDILKVLHKAAKD